MADISLPVLIPDRLLISPGYWNDNEYSSKEISDAFSRTAWDDKQKISLWLNHDDTNTSAFVGYVRNPKLASEGRVFGDLEIWDEKTATMLTQAMAKFGVSAKIKGEEDKKGKMHNFTFENFSVVTVPACSEAYINLSKKETLTPSMQYLVCCSKEDPTFQEVELAKVTGMETERKKRGMSPSQFYAAQREPPSASALPIFDKAHVQNAMARFNQTKFKSSSERATAKRKIISVANKFGIKVSDEFKSLSNIDVRRLKDMEERLQDEEKKEEVVEKKPEEEVEKENKKLSEKVDLLSEKFDKLISLLSKKLEEEAPAEEEKSEEEAKEAPAEEAPAEEKSEEPEAKEEEEVEDKELTKVKKELAEIKKKLDAPKSKTVRNLSSNTIENTADYSHGEFANFLMAVDKPVKII